MKKWKLNLVICTMVVALTGLVLVQVYWIKQAIVVNNQLFGRHVNDALQTVAAKLERKDAFAFVSRKSLKDTAILPDVGLKSVSPAALRPYLLRDLKRLNYADYNLSDLPVQFYEGVPLPGFYNYENSAAVTEPLEDTALDFDDLEALSTIKTTEEVNKVLKKKYLLQKLAVDLVQRKSTLQQRVDFLQLNALIKEELSNRNILLPYQYGIYGKQGNKMVFTSAGGTTEDILNSPYQAQLFPNDFFLDYNFLKLYFPGQKLFLIKKISAILASSLLFIILLALTFLWVLRSFLEQKKLSQMKTDFINNMTHEFKTPITTIALATEALQDNNIQKDESRLQRLAEMIREENHRLEAQVERVLQIARLQKSEFKLKLEETDMHQIIEKVISQAGLLLNEHKVQLACNLQAQKKIVNADKIYISSILFNLLENAVKYTPVQPEISVSTYNSAAGFVVEIADNGIGMSQDAQQKIFEQFYRVPTGNVHNVKGFGLGLSYVKTMAEAHKGTIEVKSSPGKGSVFTLTLPI